MALLDDTARSDFLAAHPDWSLEGETISRRFQFPGFLDAVAFVTKVAVLAEQADHHPDIDIRWNKVSLMLTTHEVGGLTEKDTRLAAALDQSV